MLKGCFFKIYLFADDTAVVASSHKTSAIINRLQGASDKICHYFRRWRIRVNPEKSDAMLFTRKTALRHIPQRCVSVNNDDVICRASDSIYWYSIYRYIYRYIRYRNFIKTVYTVINFIFQKVKRNYLIFHSKRSIIVN